MNVALPIERLGRQHDILARTERHGERLIADPELVQLFDFQRLDLSALFRRKLYRIAVAHRELELLARRLLIAETVMGQRLDHGELGQRLAARFAHRRAPGCLRSAGGGLAGQRVVGRFELGRRHQLQRLRLLLHGGAADRCGDGRADGPLARRRARARRLEHLATRQLLRRQDLAIEAAQSRIFRRVPK